MTVAECIKKWLAVYEPLDLLEINTDIVETEEGSYSISKSPNKTEKTFNDGSKLITEYYQFYAKASMLEESERDDNQQSMADLENWIEEKDFEEDYPDLSMVGNLTCQEIGISSSSTVTSIEEDSKAIYQITIEITYLKER